MNDNFKDDPAPFIQLAALVANVTRFLAPSEKEDAKRPTERDAEQTQEEKRKAHREAVEQRLRDLAAFERRASGRKN